MGRSKPSNPHVAKKLRKPEGSPELHEPNDQGQYSDMDESQLQAEIEKVTAQLQSKGDKDKS